MGQKSKNGEVEGETNFKGEREEARGINCEGVSACIITDKELEINMAALWSNSDLLTDIKCKITIFIIAPMNIRCSH